MANPNGMTFKEAIYFFPCRHTGIIPKPIIFLQFTSLLQQRIFLLLFILPFIRMMYQSRCVVLVLAIQGEVIMVLQTLVSTIMLRLEWCQCVFKCSRVSVNIGENPGGIDGIYSLHFMEMPQLISVFTQSISSQGPFFHERSATVCGFRPS